MHPLARNPRQDAEMNDKGALVHHGNTRRTHDSVIQTTAQLPEKHKFYKVAKRTLQAISRGVVMWRA